MNEKIAEAIVESVTTDQIVHINIKLDQGEDIYSVLDGVLIDDMVQLEHGEWDVWGVDEDAGGEWRLTIYLD